MWSDSFTELAALLALDELPPDCVVAPAPFHSDVGAVLQRAEGLLTEVAAMLRVQTASPFLGNEQMNRLLHFVGVLVSRTTDGTHLSVREVARLRGVTTRTVRNWIANGVMHLEVIPGTRLSGVPVDEAFAGWLDIKVAKAALNRQREEQHREKKRS